LTSGVATRIPGRRRYAGIFTGDTPTLLALFAIAILVNAFNRLEWWRSFLIGQSTIDANAALGLLVIGCALAWRAMLRRGFVWAEPAALTWLDFTGVDRTRVLGRRLLTGWLIGVAAVAYIGSLVAAATELATPVWISAAALLVGSAALSLATVRRAPGGAGIEAVAPVGLACLGVVIAVAGLAPIWLDVLGGALFVTGCVLWLSSSSIATRAGRKDLVDGWNERLVRTVSFTFLDPMLLLPSANPVRGHSLRRLTTLRLAYVGILGRARYLGTAALLAIAVGVAHAALPGLPPVVLIALGGYAALMPFGGGIGELWRNTGLRRWLDTGDYELRLVNTVVLACLVAAWGLVVELVDFVLGIDVPGAAWLALPLVVGAVLRTATRPPMTYDNLGSTDTPMGAMPTRLLTQLFRGPDVGFIGVVVLAAVPLGPVPLAVLLVLLGWSLLR
jgi:uncharacterized protein DUF6297